VTYRKIGELKNSDFVMNQVFWIGVYPGLSREMLEYVMEMFVKFTGRYNRLSAGSSEVGGL
jgi:CDP-6-deoxy-D-xylo-4-hexulose-3-dehydrase